MFWIFSIFSKFVSIDIDNNTDEKYNDEQYDIIFASQRNGRRYMNKNKRRKKR